MPSNRKTDMRTASNIVDIDARLQQVLHSEYDGLNGGGASNRQAERLALHTRFSKAIHKDGQDIYKAKSANQSTEDYVARAFLGSQYGGAANTTGIQPSTGNKNADKWLNRSKLEKIMSTGDSQVAAYFLSSLGDAVRIYDEIDSICAYMYQLEEAILSFRDNILTAEQPGEIISCDITFPNISDDTAEEEYLGIIKGLFRYQGFDKKLRDHIVPKMIKYGIYYLMIIPYTDIWVRLRMMDNNGLISGTNGNRWIFESTDNGGDAEDSTAIDTIMEAATQIMEAVDTNVITGETPNYHGKTVPAHVKEQLDIIRENAEQICVCENEAPPDDILGVPIDKLTKGKKKLSEGTQEAIQRAFRAQYNESNKQLLKLTKTKAPAGVKDKGFVADGVNDKDMIDLPGCYLKMVDPRNMVPTQVFDYTIGYYYFENYDYARMGTSLTDMLSNQMNFNQRNMIMDNIVSAVLQNLKYKDLVEGDQQLRNMILNCVLYAERRNNPIRIKFIQADYVVPFQTNTDEDGRGQPVLLRSLFYGHLYTSMLLFTISAVITKSTDSEFYYLRDSAILPQYANRVTDVMDQLEDNNVDPIAIANGNVLHGMKGINKRYFMNMGTSDQKPIETDIIAGQNIDIHNEFMTDLRKMTVGSTGCPGLIVDFIDEVQHATMIGMENVKFLSRGNSISRDVDPSLTLAMQKIAKFTNVNIPENYLDSMQIVLRKSKVISNSYDSQQFNDVVSNANTMVDIYLATGQNSSNDENMDTLKALMVKEITMRQTPSMPWEIMPSIYDEASLAMRSEMLKREASAPSGSES
ncbi:MAG: hypothetical protein NC548_29720 [Lachnospiraceae bacterium]|nr:hypothetical protein [Lachnospiraceae bacterium]